MTARTPLLALAFYILLTAVFGRHVLAQLGTSVASDAGDPLLTAAILHWNAHHVPLTDAWWQFPIFYPTRDALAFSEHLLGVSVIASPIAWLTGDPLVTYNLTMLLTFPLSAMAMYALVYRLTRSHAGAFIAGLAYGFAPYRINGLSHIQMLASFWAPLALLGLHGFTAADRPRTRLLWLALFGAAWALQGMANGYMLVYFSVLVGLWVVWFVIIPRRWRALAAITAAMLVALIPLVPILTKYAAVHARHGLERSAIELRMFSADVAGFLCAPDDLTFWGWVRFACRPEAALFPGIGVASLFVVGLAMFLKRPSSGPRAAGGHLLMARRALVRTSRILALVAALYAALLAWLLLVGPLHIDVGLLLVSASEIDRPLLLMIGAALGAFAIAVAVRFHPREPAVLGFYLCGAVVAWLFALGPALLIGDQEVGRAGPFAYLQLIPGVNGLRVPARFWSVSVLALSVVAGLAVARVAATWRSSGSATLVLVTAAVMVGDVWTPGFAAAPAPAPAPDSSALRGQVVLQAPFEVFADATATFRAVAGGWHSINGISGYLPNYYAAAAFGAKTGDTLAAFRRHHDLHVLVPDTEPGLQDLVASQSGLRRTDHGNGWRQFELSKTGGQEAAAPGRIVPIVAVRSACNPHVLHFALDGDPATAWQCPDAAQIEIAIDLGRPVWVGALIFSVGPYWWAVPEQLTIAASIDGRSWEAAETRGVLAAFIEGGLRDSRLLAATLPFAPRRARYLRIRASGAIEESSWLVSELEVRTAS